MFLLSITLATVFSNVIYNYQQKKYIKLKKK